jgi:capsular polysaccharide biosynthesis protein
MTGDQVATDLGAEREIDLRGWLDAFLSRWWIAVVGLVVGAVIGMVLSLGGSSTYTATALIARGQAYSPGGGNTVLGYMTSPAAIQAFATSPQALNYAAAKAGMSPGELRGHVMTSTVDPSGQKPAQGTNSTLVMISVALKRPKRAEDAANALAELVKKQTTSGYVEQSIQIYKTRLANYAIRLKTLQTRINSLNAVLEHPTGLSSLDQLVVASQLDAAEAAYGQTLDTQTTTQQLLTLAQQVEQTQIVQLAKAAKSTARSRRSSVVVGALIGLLVGAVVALIVGLRARRAAAA